MNRAKILIAAAVPLGAFILLSSCAGPSQVPADSFIKRDCPPGTTLRKSGFADFVITTCQENGVAGRAGRVGPLRRYLGDTLITEDFLNHGVLSGTSTAWDVDGRRIRQFSYKDGKLLGPYSYWYANGQIWSRVSEKNGSDGPATYWYPNGQKALEGANRNRRPVGQWTRWSESGDVQVQGSFVNGHPAGKWIIFEDGEKRVRFFDPKDSVCENDGEAIGAKPPLHLVYKCEHKDKDGRIYGLEQEWYPSGHLAFQLPYKQMSDNPKDLQLQGLAITWYEDGKIWEETHYRDGKSDGQALSFFPDGSKKTEGNYDDDGNADGTQRRWYASGQLRDELQYKNGKAHGRQKVWDQSGDLIYDALFENGVLKRRFK